MDFTPVASGHYLEALCVDGDTVWFSDVVQGGIQRRMPDGRTEAWLPGRRWMGGVLEGEEPFA
jgi:hypothetical protein